MSDADVPVVALVCSVGGLEAVSRVLAPLPTDLPAALLVLQHRSPDDPSMLAEVLARRTALPVATARDGDGLTPGRVLVAPAGQHMLVTPQRTIALIISGPVPPYRPSADLLLTSLALAVGPGAIAVVLSGHGNDGATGATAVDRFGGVVITSDELSSEVFTMPRATITRDRIADHVVPLDDVPGLLVALTTAPVLEHEGAGDALHQP